jgi:murein DD-endopeptidase MepM/ murein hydrolase activator NlpD
MSSFHVLRGVVAASIAAVLVLSLAPPAGGAQIDEWPYTWPVTAPVIDPFRAPASPYAAGNRGLEFNTTSGQVVVAAREGVVIFAGQVAGRTFITISHPDGVRTTYGFAAIIGVRRGEQVRKAQPIAVAGEVLHVSARIRDAYVDPAVLFGGAPGPAHLVATRWLLGGVRRSRS